MSVHPKPPPPPSGMGWTRFLDRADPALGLDGRELYQRRLTIGMAVISGAIAFVSSGFFGALGRLDSVAVLWGITLACALAVVAMNRRPGTTRWIAHGLALIPMLLAWRGPMIGGRFATSIWGLSSVMLAALLLGSRAAFAWLAVFLATMAAMLTAHLTVGLPTEIHVDLDLVYIWNYSLFGTSLAVALVWFIQQRDIAEAQLDAERARKTELLHRVLPEVVANRLEKGERMADHHEQVSVLFADLVGFTPLSDSIGARELVDMLDDLFRSFDALADRHGVEKLKTIGDCYMAAAGVPVACADHAQRVARLALDMRDLVAARDFAGHSLQLRIGINSGPAVAGVIGERRFSYDLWGDTVNTASRMESSGEPGRIQLGERMRAHLGEAFRFEERGMVTLKGKGPMRLWFLEGEVA